MEDLDQSTVLYYTTLHYTILYYTILYYTILYYHCTILYHTILYYTILHYVWAAKQMRDLGLRVWNRRALTRSESYFRGVEFLGQYKVSHNIILRDS